MAKGIVFFPKLVNETLQDQVVESSTLSKREILDWNHKLTEKLQLNSIDTKDYIYSDGYVSGGSAAVEAVLQVFKTQMQLYNFSSHVLKTKAQQELFKDKYFIEVLNKLKSASEEGLLEVNFNTSKYFMPELNLKYKDGLRSLGYKVNWPLVSWYD